LYIPLVPTQQEPTVRSLIQAQRRLAESKNGIRRMGALIAAGVLDKRLSALRDKQIGRLVIDFVERDMAIAAPETSLCRQAARRLIRSNNDSLTEPAIETDRQTCPRCGNEMLLLIGIDEPDYRQCVSLACKYKEIITSSEDKIL
jgi:hypothetical protein